MSVLEAILLGLLQGFTEFLPVSSSGHLELGKVILNVDQSLAFTVVVHFATVCSIIVVFWKDIVQILGGSFGPLLRGKPAWNPETQLSALLILSMLPVVVVYLFWGNQLEVLFEGRVLLVGIMLLVTALILWSTTWVKSGSGRVGPAKALVIGVAQAVAILPGISRSGATISTALLLGIDREKATRFAFLMVVVPIIGATILELRGLGSELLTKATMLPFAVGFVAAFISGFVACRWMLRIVRRGKIVWFAIYCALIGIVAITCAIL